MLYLYNLFSNFYLSAFFAMALALWLSLKMFPVIIHLAREKKFIDKPDERHQHNGNVPNLGGVGMYISFSLSIGLLSSLTQLGHSDLRQLLVLFVAIIILFFLGVKDDIIGLSPTKKFIGQTVVSFLVVILTDVRIYSLGGLFGIGELPYIISVLFSVLIFLTLINGFNLIDGVDGLAATVAVVCSVCFGVFFILDGNNLLVLVSFTLIGSLIGFLRFNLSDKLKLFMGDSGSLFMGFLIAYLAISFLGVRTTVPTQSIFPNPLIIVLAVLSFPIIDTTRVFIIRILHNRSPFSADRNHIHHRLLALGLSHKQTTSLVATANITIIIVSFMVKDLNVNLQLLIISIVTIILCLLPCVMVRKKGKVKLIMPQFRRLQIP